ncbi:M48 family metalloprotease [Caldimonas sp. KR1-144]|uniref:M48 family metalloprotease n=1 Tax=Caldimonas sp. KR1-144 TaxID=3400911 RepID=UPI003C0B4983
MSLSRVPSLRRLAARATVFAMSAALLSGGTGALLADARAQASNALPALGDSASEDVPINYERKIGDRIMREIWRDPQYLDDPVLLEYLRGIWRPLVQASRVAGNITAELDDRFAFQIFLVRDPSVNAFALPGGWVGVHLGLLSATHSPDELASVLAHELSHVTQRHIARSVSAGKTASLISMASLLLGIIAASRSADAANALITGGQAVSAQGQLNYSRDFEREADRIGFGVLTGAGYAATGMSQMFETLLRASRLNDSQNFPYLRTHPLSTERIGEARARLGVDAGSLAMPSRPLVHALMQARARVLMDPTANALQRQQASDAASAPSSAGTPGDRLAAAYASALASVLLKDWSRAEAALAVARPIAAGDAAATRVLDLLAAEALIARANTGDAAAAARTGELVDTLSRSLGARESRPVLFYSAQRALVPGSTAEQQKSAADRLQTWVALHPADAGAWQLLAQFWERLGERLRAVRAGAEARAAIGDLPGAIERLRAGQRLTRSSSADYIEASVIDARLRELQAQRRAEWAEEGRTTPPPEDRPIPR